MPYTHIVVRKSGYIAGWFDGEPPAGFVEECNANVPGDPAHAEELDGDEAWAGLLDAGRPAASETGEERRDRIQRAVNGGDEPETGGERRDRIQQAIQGEPEDQPCPACGCTGGH